MDKFKDLKDFLMVHDEPRQVACYRGHGKHHRFAPTSSSRSIGCRNAATRQSN